jgi:tetratricopeptide (TPR) repeat protein
LIPPGAADTVHYRLHVPENAGEQLNLHAKLNYRKFQWWNTQFAFAGRQEEAHANPDVSPDYDDRKVAFNGDLSIVSGKSTGIPDLPIVTVAEDTKTLRVLPHSAAEPAPQTVWSKEDWTRWNDYGIGLFLEGDLKGAEQAFLMITEMDPQNPDGWTNVGRVRVQEGNTEGALPVLQKALTLKPGLPRANFFYARVLKEEGKYDQAAEALEAVLADFPRDRVVHNELGRVLFLEKRYSEAVKEFEKTLLIDPEDLQANYNLMLCYTGLGDEARANQHKDRYLRFKADESAQALTGAYRQTHPEDNNERQAIHEHVSVALDGAPSASTTKSHSTFQGRPAKKAAAGAGR